AQGCAFNPRNPASPGTAGSAANPYNSQDLEGERLPRAPKWVYSTGATYEYDIGSSLRGSISADGSYQSSYSPDIEANPNLIQDGHWILNANLTIGAANKGWELSLIGRNLTNDHSITSAGGSPLTGSGTGTTTAVLGDSFGSLIEPRSILLQLKITSALFRR
ncbi:MAG: TonB-dependent receptor, partial [Burkholderiales bacterium]